MAYFKSETFLLKFSLSVSRLSITAYNYYNNSVQARGHENCCFLSASRCWWYLLARPPVPARFTLSRGLGRRIHESVEDTKLNTNKQHSLWDLRHEKGAVFSSCLSAHLIGASCLLRQPRAVAPRKAWRPSRQLIFLPSFSLLLSSSCSCSCSCSCFSSSSRRNASWRLQSTAFPASALNKPKP